MTETMRKAVGEGRNFERIRRITGYLTGTIDGWNNAKRAEEKEPLLHCAVYMELKAPSLQKLKELQSDVLMELTRSKINIDRLNLRQKEGFLSVTPFGANLFGTQFERVLPASAVANLYPFNYSGKTDPHGFYLGRDKFPGDEP